MDDSITKIRRIQDLQRAINYSLVSFQAGDLAELSLIVTAVIYIVNPKADAESIFTRVYVESFIRNKYTITIHKNIEYIQIPIKTSQSSQDVLIVKP